MRHAGSATVARVRSWTLNPADMAADSRAIKETIRMLIDAPAGATITVRIAQRAEAFVPDHRPPTRVTPRQTPRLEAPARTHETAPTALPQPTLRERMRRRQA